MKLKNESISSPNQKIQLATVTNTIINKSNPVPWFSTSSYPHHRASPDRALPGRPPVRAGPAAASAPPAAPQRASGPLWRPRAWPAPPARRQTPAAGGRWPGRAADRPAEERRLTAPPAGRWGEVLVVAEVVPGASRDPWRRCKAVEEKWRLDGGMVTGYRLC